MTLKLLKSLCGRCYFLEVGNTSKVLSKCSFLGSPASSVVLLAEHTFSCCSGFTWSHQPWPSLPSSLVPVSLTTSFLAVNKKKQQ